MSGQVMLVTSESGYIGYIASPPRSGWFGLSWASDLGQSRFGPWAKHVLHIVSR